MSCYIAKFCENLTDCIILLPNSTNFLNIDYDCELAIPAYNLCGIFYSIKAIVNLKHVN